MKKLLSFILILFVPIIVGSLFAVGSLGESSQVYAESCSHTYTNGICTKCYERCEHFADPESAWLYNDGNCEDGSITANYHCVICDMRWEEQIETDGHDVDPYDGFCSKCHIHVVHAYVDGGECYYCTETFDAEGRYISGSKGGSIILGEKDASGRTLDSFTMNGGTINNHYAEKGGAVYVASGTKFIMNGGTIKRCTASKGGAIYVEAGGECYLNGGTIEYCAATDGLAIYVEDGGYLEISEDYDGITKCGSDYSISIFAENLLNVKRPIEIYVSSYSYTIKTWSNISLWDISYTEGSGNSAQTYENFLYRYNRNCWSFDGIDVPEGIDSTKLLGYYVKTDNATIVDEGIHQSYTNRVCDRCGNICDHYEGEVDVFVDGVEGSCTEGNVVWTWRCGPCNYTWKEEKDFTEHDLNDGSDYCNNCWQHVCEHQYESGNNGVCIKCGYECKHEDESAVYLWNISGNCEDGNVVYEWRCEVCISIFTEEKDFTEHDYQFDGNNACSCNNCGDVIFHWELKNYGVTSCPACGWECTHNDEDGNNICDWCDTDLYEDPWCNWVNCEDSDGDGFCDYCGSELGGGSDDPACGWVNCEDSDGDSYCDYCGALVGVTACTHENAELSSDSYEATCIESGLNCYTCLDCGYQWAVTTPPTGIHIQEDLYSAYCSYCGEKVFNPIEFAPSFGVIDLNKDSAGMLIKSINVEQEQYAIIKEEEQEETAFIKEDEE